MSQLWATLKRFFTGVDERHLSGLHDRQAEPGRVHDRQAKAQSSQGRRVPDVEKVIDGRFWTTRGATLVAEGHVAITFNDYDWLLKTRLGQWLVVSEDIDLSSPAMRPIPDSMALEFWNHAPIRHLAYRDAFR
jgi:hypothetical protein